MAQTISVRTNVKVDDLQFQRHVALYLLVMNKDMALGITKIAQLLCKDMVNYTPPFSGAQPSSGDKGDNGFGLRARDKGRAAVSRDVRKIFAPFEQAPAATVANYGDVGIFEQWINAKRKLPAPHYPGYVFEMVERTGGFVTDADFKRFQKAEQSKGGQSARLNTQVDEGWIKTNHVSRRGPTGDNKPYNVKTSLKNDILYVQPWAMVEKYIKKVQRRVGRLKSGWYACYKALGGKKGSGWIAAQGSSEMILVKDMGNLLSPKITVGNHIGRNFRQSWAFFRMAIDHRAYAMRNAIIRHIANPRNHGRLKDVARRLPTGFDIKDE